MRVSDDNPAGQGASYASGAPREVPQDRRHRLRVGPLVVCAISFATLSIFLQFAMGRAGEVPPQTMTEAVADSTVGEWVYTGTVGGWTTEIYPVGSSLLAYDRNDEDTMLVTSGVSQQRDRTFANIATVHGQQGHQLLEHIPVRMENTQLGSATDVKVSIYSPSPTAPGFAFVGLYYNGKSVTGNLWHVKSSVSLHQALGRPMPWVAAYFARPCGDSDEQWQQAIDDLQAFTDEFMPSMERLFKQYSATASS